MRGFDRFFNHCLDAAIAEPKVAEVKRPVVDFDAIASRASNQSPARPICELVDQIEQGAVEVAIPRQQGREFARAGDDSMVLSLVQREGVGADELLQRLHERIVERLVLHHSDAFDSRSGLNPHQSVLVGVTLRPHIVGVHRHEFVEAALNRCEDHAGDPGPGGRGS